MKLVNGARETEHPSAIPIAVAALAAIFMLQHQGLNLNVALLGGGRENIFPGGGAFDLPVIWTKLLLCK